MTHKLAICNVLQETCKLCKEDWSEHFGKPCSEIEKKDETKIRLALYDNFSIISHNLTSLRTVCRLLAYVYFINGLSVFYS